MSIGRPGETFGSVSNLVLSLTAVVWSERRGRYVLRTFGRDDPACAGLLTHLGRALVTSVTLRAGPLRRVRCVSYTDVPADELFAAPGAAGRTFASFLEASGRVEAIWYPFTDAPWLKVWTVSPRRPAGARVVRAPYNYPFSDTLPDAEQRAIRQGVLANPSEAVALGQASYAETVAQLGAENSGDIWGAAKDVLLYVRPSTLRVTANGYAILTRRRDVQRVISDFVGRYRAVVARYRAQGLYPLNMPVEIRVTGLDHPRDVGVDGAQPALLSALAPRADHPHWDVAVWLDILPCPAPRRQPRLPGHRALDLRHYRPPYAAAVPVVEGLGLHRARRLDQPQVPRTDVAPRLSGRAAAGSNLGRSGTHAERLDPHAVFTSPLCARCCAPAVAEPGCRAHPLGPLLPSEQAKGIARHIGGAPRKFLASAALQPLRLPGMEAERRRCQTNGGVAHGREAAPPDLSRPILRSSAATFARG